MKWVLWIVGVPAALMGLAALIGAMLPLRHHGTKKSRFRVSPEALYAVLAGPPDWRTGVKSFGALPDEGGRKRWWEQDTHGKKVTFELVEEAPPRKLAVRIADRGLPFSGTWSFEITPDGAGSELRISEDGEIYNVIFRFMARFIFGYTGSIETYLTDLGAKFDEPVTIEA
jgi:hypothetical protein